MTAVAEVRKSPLEMSDEELAGFNPEAFLVDELHEEEPTQSEPVIEDTDAQETPDTSEQDDEDDDEVDTPADEALTSLEVAEDEEAADDETADVPTNPPEVAEAQAQTEVDTPDAQIDYRKEYERLTAPFKANGREIAVNSVDDAIALMQMGANYNKKMAALKPNLKLLKLLENNSLLSEEKIGFLIDLEKKNPEAINKLVKESGIDPMDLDAEKAGQYKPGNYTVSDKEIELDTVLEEIQDTPTYNRTLDVIGTKWDKASKQVVAEQPQLIKVINDHVERGIYDVIVKEIERERTFGRLNGLSDLEAYRQVGDAIQAKGGFDHLGRQGHQNPPSPRVVTPNPKKEDDSKLREKKRAASSTKPAVPSHKPSDFNPLALSDEEFSKLVNNKFL